jgi:hypothetical protein
MDTYSETAMAFMNMAHRIVWCTAATVDSLGRPRSRVLHPLWEWDGSTLTGWIGTRPTPTKRSHLKHHPYISANYWEPSHDTCVAECRAELLTDDDTRRRVWDLFLNGPPPVGYNPLIVSGWDSPTAKAFAVIKLVPWRLRVFPGSLLLGQGGNILSWQG